MHLPPLPLCLRCLGRFQCFGGQGVGIGRQSRFRKLRPIPNETETIGTNVPDVQDAPDVHAGWVGIKYPVIDARPGYLKFEMKPAWWVVRGE